MKAPEKLYVDAEDRLGDSILYGFTEKRKDDDIEYIRKDAFIKNTCEWLTKHAKKYYFSKERYLGTEELVEDFKLSMEIRHI